MPVMPTRLLDLFGKQGANLQVDLPDGTATTEIRVETPFVALRIVMESDVISIALPRQIEPEVVAGRLATLPLDMPWLRSVYGIVLLARRTPSPAAVEFLKVLREVEVEIEAEERHAAPRA